MIEFIINLYFILELFLLLEHIIQILFLYQLVLMVEKQMLVIVDHNQNMNVEWIYYQKIMKIWEMNYKYIFIILENCKYLL